MKTEFITPDDSRWQEFLSKTPHDFYHLPEYASFASTCEGGRPVAYLAEDKGAALLIPLLIKDLPPQLEAAWQGSDALSPYGYPGPLLWGTSDPAIVERMLRRFVEVSKETGIISIFLRSHPLMRFPVEPLETIGRVVNHGQTVHCDLSASLETMWSQTSQNHRRNIRKLQKNGFVAVRNDWSRWDQFKEVYRATMRRVGAREFYLFSEHYFEGLKGALGDKLDLWTVLSPEGEVAAGGLFVTTDGIVEYHLGGTTEQFLGIAPSKLMFADVRQWAKEAGHRLLHLGGGLGGETDSLFQFKAGFSHDRRDFFTLRAVVDQDHYEQLERKWHSLFDNSGQEGMGFPIYRNGL